MLKKIITIIGVVSITITSIFYMSCNVTKNIVSYKEYKKGNSTNQILDKILSDNTLQVEKENMFNYASNGMYISGVGTSGPEYATDESQKTTGLYSMEDEDGVSYYYRGNVDNNNVQFGEYKEDYYVYESSGSYFQSLESCQEYSYGSCSESNKVKLASAGDKMYWKLVRVNGDGSLRLIYNGTSTTPDNSDLAHSYAVGNTPYNLSYNEPKYTGYTYDNGTDSFIKKEVDTWYSKALGNTEYDSKVIGGRFCSDSSGYKPASDYGFEGVDGVNAFASYDRLGQSATGYAKSNSPTLKCPVTTESYGGSYRLKAGLITADELVLAGESFEVFGDSYLNYNSKLRVMLPDTSFWTMTPVYCQNPADTQTTISENRLLNLEVQPYGMVKVLTNIWSYRSSSVSINFGTELLGIRPVINLSNELGIEGDGSSENPYQIVEKAKHNGVITIAINSNVNLLNAFENINIPSGVTWRSLDPSIAIIENGKIVGLKDGQTTLIGVSSDGLTTYEIKVTVLKNPVTMSSIYIIIGLLLIVSLATTLCLYYKKKFTNL